MSDLLDLLDWTDTPEWEPIYQPSIASVGWHWTDGKGLPQHADETPITKAEWNAYLASYRCRDCGGKVPHTRGGSANGGWSLCRECGVIEDCTAPWGGEHYNHSGYTLADLLARRERRRADHRKAVT